MAIDVETFVFKAALDSKEATRNSAELEKKLRHLEQVEKALTQQSHSLKEAMVRLAKEELKGGEAAKVAAQKRRAGNVLLREERLEVEKVRRSIAGLRQEQAREAMQAKETARAHDQLARATARAEQAAARDATRSAAIVVREAGRAERARDRSARAEIRIRSNNAKDIASARRINERETAIAELDKRLMELTTQGSVRQIARRLGSGARGFASQHLTPEGIEGFAGRSAGRFARGVPGALRATAGVALGAGVAGAGAVGGIASVGSSYEGLRAQLSTSLGGDASAGDKAFEQIKKFAKETPYAVEEVTRAVTTLKVRGLEPTVEAALEAMRTYGDVAGAMGKDLPTVIEAVSDASVGEFERLKEAFNVVGHKSGDELRLTFNGVTTQIHNDSKSITDYLKQIGKVNFAGGMERQSKTLAGTWSNLGDAVMNFADEIYRGGLGDALKEVLGDITENIGGSESLAEVIGERLGNAVRDVYGFFRDLLGPTSELPDKFKAAWETGEKLSKVVGTLISVAAKLGEVLGPGGVALVAFGVAATSALGPIGLLAAAGVGLGMAFSAAANSIRDAMDEVGAVERYKKKQAEEEARNKLLVEIGERNEESTRREINTKEGGKVWAAGQSAQENFIKTRLRKLGKTSIEQLSPDERKQLERQANSIRRSVQGDINAQHGLGAGERAERAATAAVAAEMNAADWAEFDRLKATGKSRKLRPSEDKRFKELAKTLDQPIAEKKAGKATLTAAEQEQKHRIDEAVKNSELRAADEARLTGRGADALKLAKAAGKETRGTLEGQARRGEALPHEIDTAFERIAGYENVAGAPPPPVVVKNYSTTITVQAPLTATGFDGSPQEFGALAIAHITEGLETHVFPQVKKAVETDMLR